MLRADHRPFVSLASLKLMAEGLPKADFSDMEIEHIVVEATDIAFQATSSVPEAAAISDAMGRAYFNILGFIDENNLQIDDRPAIPPLLAKSN